MATFVPCASCYGKPGPVQLFGMSRTSGYLSLFACHGPLGAPRSRLVYHAPRLTLRQICQLIRVMKQIRMREAAMASTLKIQSSAPAGPAPSVVISSEKQCLTACFRRRRSGNIKRAG